MPKLITQDDFVVKASKIHQNKYSYDEVRYVNAHTKVKIICPEHGVFEQTPASHLNNRGCPKCGVLKSREYHRDSLADFIEKAVAAHGDKYNYDLVDYQNSSKKVKINCPKHGTFEQAPQHHCSGHGCIRCAAEQKNEKYRKSLEDFVAASKEVHNNKYNYSETTYQNTNKKIQIICPEHGMFEQTPRMHLKGHGCKRCADIFRGLEARSTTEKFVEKAVQINGDRYDYSNCNYTCAEEKVNIVCKIHGEWSQLPGNHLSGYQCPKCANFESKQETAIAEFLGDLNIEYIRNDRAVLNGLELDLFIPEKQVAIEYNGIYWHSDRYKPDDFHLNKTILCEKQGIRLIHIFEDDWILKRDIIESRLKNLLQTTSNKLFARKCQIKEVSKIDSKKFLNENHLQGYVPSAIRLGLYLEDNLVSLMTLGSFRKSLGRNSEKDCYELLRFCNILDTHVVGAASKLLKHFERQYAPKKVITYADRCWSTGNLYEKLNFERVHNSKPSYYYFDKLQRFNRFKFRKSELVKKGHDATKTERQIMDSLGYFRVYNCGNILFEKNY